MPRAWQLFLEGGTTLVLDRDRKGDQRELLPDAVVEVAEDQDVLGRVKARVAEDVRLKELFPELFLDGGDVDFVAGTLGSFH